MADEDNILHKLLVATRNYHIEEKKRKLQELMKKREDELEERLKKEEELQKQKEKKKAEDLKIFIRDLLSKMVEYNKSSVSGEFVGGLSIGDIESAMSVENREIITFSAKLVNCCNTKVTLSFR